MNKENIVYLKTKRGKILKCYESEQMHKSIYYPIESKTNGYVDWNDVEKIFTINDFYKENTNLKQALNEIRKMVEENAIEVNTREYGNLTVTNIDDILQIIDKVGLGDKK